MEDLKKPSAGLGLADFDLSWQVDAVKGEGPRVVGEWRGIF